MVEDRKIEDINVDFEVVEDFGREWEVFDHDQIISSREIKEHFEAYFRMFPWNVLPENAEGFDAGCGSGRWAWFVSPRVGHLHCVEPSSAIDVAKRILKDKPNCSFHKTTIDSMPFSDNSMDFAYSLGVLHHLPDPEQGLKDCVRALKPGAPMLVYLYYAFDNQPLWFRKLWQTSDLVRRFVSARSYRKRYFISQIIAALVYWPLARMALLGEKVGVPMRSWPLSAYRKRSFYMMRTDSLDRFGTRLEWRFTKAQIFQKMEDAGLENISVGEERPYYCAVGYKR